MRRQIYNFSRSFVRLLNRAAPRFVNFGATVLADELDRTHRIAARKRVRKKPRSNKKRRSGSKGTRRIESKGTQCTVPLAVGDVHFMLSLTPNPPWWDHYRESSKTGKPYEPVMLACISRILQHSTNPRFMDVGAYLGYFATYVSAVFGGRQDVYAVESNPVYAAAIRESARINGFPKLKAYQVALSDRIERVSIDGVTVRHDVDPQETTLTDTLDSLCSREEIKPTIIKIDAHGAEGKIILGMPNTLANVECVLLELHRLPFLAQYSPGVSRTKLLDALEDGGLTLYYVAGHSGSIEMPFQELMAGKSFSYRRLDRAARDLLLFDRGQDEFIIGLRHNNIEALLGPSVSASNE